MLGPAFPVLWRLWRLILALAIVVAANSTISAATIVFLGDSLTAGRGVAVEAAYPAVVQALARADGHEWTAINAGISGDTSDGGLRRLDALLERQPDLLVIALGANDGLRGLPVARMHANLDALVRRCGERHIRCVLAGMRVPPNYGAEYGDAFAAVFPAVAQTHQTPLLPFLLDGVAGNPQLNQGDGIHPTTDGQRIIARHVYDFLLPLLEKPLSQEQPQEPRP